MGEAYINPGDVERRIPITGIPTDVNTALTSSASVATNTIQTYTITTTVPMRYLSLWDFAITIRVGTDDDDHVWPNGASLTASQRSLDPSSYRDWASSNDTTNKMVYKVHVRNFSADTHTIYIKFKAYTFAYITGSSA